MKTTAEYALNGLLRTALDAAELDLERIHNLLDEVRIAGVDLDLVTLEFTLRKTLERMSDRFSENPADLAFLRTLTEAMSATRSLPISLVLWSIQNKCYEVMQRQYPLIRDRAAAGDPEAQSWTTEFERLAELLMLRLTVM
jgi:hypothetical protein